MCGLWVSDLYYNSSFVDTDILTDQYIFDEENKLVIIAKIFDPTGFRRDVYFSIVIYNLTSNELIRYKEKFNAITLSHFIDGKLFFYNSFNSQFLETRDSIEVSELLNNSTKI